ncbi:speckle targeted PIP5K1A-regulated poly(A) polymerase isoform X2 [Cryptotermes secundus]|uniref:speckle targeted PIP5K1A-regulated poly(A) polymerase isoform X2 n=1 Tax=Cryptotermes secundus TaxID=105785 RepID=UPI000CD7C221|nr:speckle targeted PIP5K1A-regulated poly(A) polymerase isoform X2 [Cryptotermes secundus]
MENPLKCEICKVDMPNVCWESHLQGFRGPVNQEHLKAFFRQFGQIRKLTYDRQSKFAIVQFSERQSAQMCLSKELYYRGHVLHVKQREIRAPLNQGPCPQKATSEEFDHVKITTALSLCEDNFEVQFAALLNEIHLSDYSKYGMVCRHLESTFSVAFPGCKAYPFGSAVTGLAFKWSDLDVFMDLNDVAATQLEGGSVSLPVPESLNNVVNHAKKLFRKPYLFSKVFAIPKAKTPIVKFIHKPTNINCDLSFKNALGVNNSALIKFYLSLDPRLKPFLIVIKYWAKKNDLSGQCKLSNYALIMIALFYVQQLEVPIIPPVATLQEGVDNKVIIDGWECSINTNISPQNSNRMSVPEMLCGFFKFFSTFDYQMNVICPLVGTSVPKSVFHTPEELPEAMKHYKEYMSTCGSDSVGLRVDCDMCVQDAFELRHNVTSGVSSKVLENFKKYCEAAAKACDEELSSTDSAGPTFLKKLFDESTKPVELPLCHITIPLEKYLTCKFPQNLDSPQDESSASTEDELRKGLYKSVLKFLIEIFEDIMKFEVQIEEFEHNSKIQKLEGQSDIGENVLDCGGVTEIHCSGYCKTWTGRKHVPKKVELPANMVTIMKEKIISDFLFKKFKEQASTCDPVVTFRCIFRPKKEPTRVILELSDKKSYKGDFKVLAGFLNGRVPIWIERCMTWQQQVAKKQV